MYRGKYVSNEAPVKKSPSTGEKKVRKKEKPHHSKTATIIFYSIYGLLILSFIVGMVAITDWLKDWLVEFESSQPDNVSVRVFEEHFAAPDWQHLFSIANEWEGYTYESAEEYADFMAEKLKGTTISMIETSAGLSGGKKYIVRAVYSNGDYLDFATFTLAEQAHKNSQITSWQLSEVVLRAQQPPAPVTYHYTFLIDSANTVSVNGVALDESHIIRTVTTKVDDFLPEGLTGYHLTELYIEGLETPPEVLLTDPTGTEIPMDFDPDTATYTQDLSRTPISEEEKSALLNAATTYCEYMIRATSAEKLRSWFDSSKRIYSSIIYTDSWMQSYKAYKFSEEQTVSSYYRYSDTLFTAMVTLTLDVTRPDGSVKVYELDTTFFMEKKGSGWKVIDMTNVDMQEQITQVRMTYRNTDGTLIHTEMLDSGVKRLTPPVVQTPEGQIFRGWATKSAGENGENVFTIIYLPNEDGIVSLPSQSELAPTTLYAIFEPAEVE